MDRRKIIDFAILMNVASCCLILGAQGKEVEVKGELKDYRLTTAPAAELKSVRVPTQTVAQCYCWVDASGNMTWGQLKNVPMECFQGFDKIKGWSRGLIRKPIVGR